MADDSDNEKTEEPTDRRIREAVEKGQVIFSREVTNFMLFALLAMNIIWLAPIYMKQATFDLSRFIHSPHELFPGDSGGIAELSEETIFMVLSLMTIPMVAAMFVAIFSSFMQHGIVISSEPIMPKLEKISVFKGIGRLFSMRSFMEFVKGLIKISLVGAVSYAVVAPEVTRLQQLISFSVADLMDMLSTLGFRVVLAAAAVMMLIAIIDYLYQRFEYLKNLRMSRQEIKEEFKNSEGSPEIKARLRQLRMERARNRMMSAVPDADVVIRNPTHYAVALKYDDASMSAPMVVAMGQDNVALRIIDKAEEHDVPVVTNRPLARALFENSEIDAEIPLDHYKAVAEIISYIYQLKGKKRSV